MAHTSATFAGLKPVYGGIQGDPFPGKTVTTRKPGQFYIDSEPVGVPNATTCRINPQDIGKILAHDGVGETVRIWHPSDIPGLTMALLPDPATMVSDIDFSIPADIGEPVRAWLDSSGNGNHAEQTTANQQPRRGFLGAKGNMLRYSNDLTNPVWNKNTISEAFIWEPSDEKDPVGGTPIRIWTEAGSGRGSWGVAQPTSILPGMQVQVRAWVKALTEYPITPTVMAVGGIAVVGGNPAITIDDGWIIRQSIPTRSPSANTVVGVCGHNSFGSLPLDVNYLVGSVVCTDVSWGHWIYNVYTTDEAVIPQEGDYPAAVYAGYVQNANLELNPEIFQGDWELFMAHEIPGNKQPINNNRGILLTRGNGALSFTVENFQSASIPGSGSGGETMSPQVWYQRAGESTVQERNVRETLGTYQYYVSSTGPLTHSRNGSRPTVRGVRLNQNESKYTVDLFGRESIEMSMGDPTIDEAYLWGPGGTGYLQAHRSNISAVITYDRNLTEQERKRVNDFLQVACKIHLPGPGR